MQRNQTRRSSCRPHPHHTNTCAQRVHGRAVPHTGTPRKVCCCERTSPPTDMAPSSRHGKDTAAHGDQCAAEAQQPAAKRARRQSHTAPGSQGAAPGPVDAATASLAGGLTPFEAERQARIAANKVGAHAWCLWPSRQQQHLHGQRCVCVAPWRQCRHQTTPTHALACAHPSTHTRTLHTRARTCRRAWPRWSCLTWLPAWPPQQQQRWQPASLAARLPARASRPSAAAGRLSSCRAARVRARAGRPLTPPQRVVLSTRVRGAGWCSQLTPHSSAAAAAAAAATQERQQQRRHHPLGRCPFAAAMAMMRQTRPSCSCCSSSCKALVLALLAAAHLPRALVLRCHGCAWRGLMWPS
jgi:hypothetical protein